MKRKIRILAVALVIISSSISLMGQSTWTLSAPYITTSSTPLIGGGVRSGSLSPHVTDTISLGLMYFERAFLGTTELISGSPVRNAVFGSNHTEADILFVNKVNSTYTYYERMRINRWGRVGIGTPTPDTSALLHVSSTNKGLLIPNIALTSTSDATTITLPATSLLVYCTGTGGLSPAGYYYNAGTSSTPNWIRFGASTGWDIVGNSGTTASTAAIGSTVNNNFIGTTDNKDWVMATNNLERARIKADGKVGIGTSSPSTKLNVALSTGSTPFDGLRIDGQNSGYIDFVNYTSTSNELIPLIRGASSTGMTASGTPGLYIQGQATNDNVNNPAVVIRARKPTSDAATTASPVLQIRNWTANLMTVDYTGNVIIGYTVPLASGITSTTPKLTVAVSGNNSVGIFKGYVNNSTAGGILTLAHSRGAAVGTETATSSGDLLGRVSFDGVNNSSAAANAAYIDANQDGAIGTNNIPGRLAFFTGTNSALPTEKMRITSAGDVGIGTTSPTALLSVNGDANKTGSSTWGSFCDIRLKKDTSAFTDGLEVIKKIHPIRYKYNGKMGIKDTNSTFIGVVAQQMQQDVPYTVETFMAKLDSTDTQETELLTYDPNALFYLFVNAFKELDSVNVKKDSEIGTLNEKVTQLDSMNTLLQNQLLTTNNLLQNQLNELQAMINSCCNRPMQSSINGDSQTKSINIIGAGETSQMDVKLSDMQSIVLEQNVPNPFAEQTTINYVLPDNTVKAQMLFYNSQGKLIQSTELSQKGSGQLNVFASDLSNGIYTYTLVVDGRIVDSKKMIRNK